MARTTPIRYRGRVVAEHVVLEGRAQLSIHPEHGPGATMRNSRLRYAGARARAPAPPPHRARGPDPRLAVYEQPEGLPIRHEVYEGNAAETRTLVPTIEKVLARFPIRRVVLVAECGLLSLDNLQAIGALRAGASRWSSSSRCRRAHGPAARCDRCP